MKNIPRKPALDTKLGNLDQRCMLERRFPSPSIYYVYIYISPFTNVAEVTFIISHAELVGTREYWCMIKVVKNEPCE